MKKPPELPGSRQSRDRRPFYTRVIRHPPRLRACCSTTTRVRRRIEALLNGNLVENDHAADVVDRHLMRRALDLLSLRERSVIVLRQYRQLSVQETAVAMRMSEQAVRSLHHRAVRKLRDALAKETLETSHGT